jgi:hypothetical protein
MKIPVKTKKMRLVRCILILGLIILIISMAGCSSKRNAVKLSSITLTPTSPVDLTVSYAIQFEASGKYSDGSTEDISSEVIWSNSDATVATVENGKDGGTTTGLKTGRTDITASSEGVTSRTVNLLVTALTSIKVIPNPPVNLAVGSTEQFTAIGNNWDNSTTDISSQVIWASNNTAVATINSAGLVTGVMAGNTNITAALYGFASPVIILTVVAPQPSRNHTNSR